MIVYTVQGRTYRRCPLWPIGGTGPAPVVPHVEGQAKRGPRNVLVMDDAGMLVVRPMRGLRRMEGE